MNITAIVVTKGDVDLKPVLDSLHGFDEVIVWDNMRRLDSKVYGRFAAIQEADNEVIYVQDDDVIVQTPHLVCGYFDPGMVVANVPPERRGFYSDGITLIGWGAVFHRSAVNVFDQYLAEWPMDDLFLRECDRIFTGLNHSINIDVPFQHLPYAHGLDRMGSEMTHLVDLAEIRTRLAYLKSKGK
jgi:hypothetical protein